MMPAVPALSRVVVKMPCNVHRRLTGQHAEQ